MIQKICSLIIVIVLMGCAAQKTVSTNQESLGKEPIILKPNNTTGQMNKTDTDMTPSIDQTLGQSEMRADFDQTEML